MTRISRIEWVPGRDARDENAAQVERLVADLRQTAAELEAEVRHAEPQRRHMSPDATKGRLGMIYVDERARVSRALARELRATVDRLEAIQ